MDTKRHMRLSEKAKEGMSQPATPVTKEEAAREDRKDILLKINKSEKIYSNKLIK